MREPPLRRAWSEVIGAGAVGSCAPQRAEFRRSARNLDEYEQMNQMFRDLYPDVAVSKATWRWIETAQYRLVRGGVHRALSLVDLLVCAVADQRGLVILHDDNDFVTAARHLDGLAQRRVRDVPASHDSD